MFKSILNLCDSEPLRPDVDDPLSEIIAYNNQRLENLKTVENQLLSTRLRKRKQELNNVRTFISKPEVELIGFIGWGQGCLGQLDYGTGTSAVEGFLYRENGIVHYQKLGSSVEIFNKLTPDQQQSHDIIDGPFVTKFAQIIAIKGLDGRDIHKVYNYNPKNPQIVTQKNLNEIYPNGYGILQSKKAAKYLLEFDDWFHSILQQDSRFYNWWHSNLVKYNHNQKDKSIDPNFLKIKSVHDPLHNTATKSRLAALANNQGSVFTHTFGIEEDFSQHLTILSKSLVENNKYAFLDYNMSNNHTNGTIIDQLKQLQGILADVQQFSAEENLYFTEKNQEIDVRMSINNQKSTKYIEAKNNGLIPDIAQDDLLDILSEHVQINHLKFVLIQKHIDDLYQRLSKVSTAINQTIPGLLAELENNHG